MESQCTSRLLMIRPAHFGYNVQTSDTNSFQSNPATTDDISVNDLAQHEFDTLVELLQSNDIEVRVFQDTTQPIKPDALFPNNWISTHEDGSIITYSLLAPSRRNERRWDIIQYFEKEFVVKQRYEFEHFEEEGKILEGTGSMVLDRTHRIVYACLSPRTDAELLDRFALIKRYQKIIFHASDKQGLSIYHTNVIMAIGQQEAILCLECIPDEYERLMMTDSLKQTGKTILNITWDQVLRFAGNMLQVKNKKGVLHWIMSSSAYASLTESQLSTLGRYSKIIHSPIPTIESIGGGSVRCMLAEVFLTKK